jgi:hypothetical protein
MGMHKRQLPIVDPCRESWDEMRPDGRGRHCERCDYTVVDLSTVTEREAKKIVGGARGRLCVRYLVDEQGDLVFRAPPMRRGVERLAAGLGLASMLSAATPAFADTSLPMHGRAESGQTLAGAALTAAAASSPVSRPLVQGRTHPTAAAPAPPASHRQYLMGDVSPDYVDLK